MERPLDAPLKRTGWRTVEAGRPAEVDFTASKTGNFPLIVAASHIAVAQIRVDAEPHVYHPGRDAPARTTHPGT